MSTTIITDKINEAATSYKYKFQILISILNEHGADIKYIHDGVNILLNAYK